MNTKFDQSLASMIEANIEHHLRLAKAKPTQSLYEDFLAEIEPALFETVMRYTRNNNQSQAAKILGLSRGTTRKKLKLYFGETYCTSRDEDENAE